MQENLAQNELRTVVGVRLPKSARIYYFDPGNLVLDRGMRVLVATENGQVWGEVVVPPRRLPLADIPQPLQPVIRLWRPEDADELERLKAREKEARAFCQERIEARGLPMRLVDVEWTFDGGKATFYFVAEGRVDFRELVYDLAARYHCRVELRQIGVRDHARMLGGHGPCGRPLCCTTFLREFAPVAIRMAKEQNLSLNPGRISGMCGRLMCCLRFEEDSEGCSPAKGDGNNGLLADERNEAAEPAVSAEENTCCLPGVIAGSDPEEENSLENSEPVTNTSPPEVSGSPGGDSCGTQAHRSRRRRAATAGTESDQAPGLVTAIASPAPQSPTPSHSKGKERRRRRSRSGKTGRSRRARSRKGSRPAGPARAAEAG